MSLGGSHSHSASTNQSYNFLSNTLSPQVEQGTAAAKQAGGLVGLGGADASNAAFQNYLGSSGYKAQLDAGSSAITDNAAASGLLNSGSTLKSLTQYGQQLGSSYFQQFFSNLMGLLQGGQNAAGTLANAGQQTKSSENKFSFGYK